MKTKSGFETNGTYVKRLGVDESRWFVETENEEKVFLNERDADRFISEIGKPNFRKCMLCKNKVTDHPYYCTECIGRGYF